MLSADGLPGIGHGSWCTRRNTKIISMRGFASSSWSNKGVVDNFSKCRGCPFSAFDHRAHNAPITNRLCRIQTT